MGSLIASHLVAALINAALGGIWGYVAMIESATPPESSPGEPQQEQPAEPPAERFSLALQLSTLASVRSETRERGKFDGLALDFRAAEQPGGYVPSAPVTRPLIGSAVHLEMPRIAPNGQFVRPRIVIGLASSEMKSWMRSQGISAEQCMLPLIRLRARLNQETRELSAGLSLIARCTFY